MASNAASLDVIRRHAELLFRSIGISRIIVVDDEYAGETPGVEDLIGFCAEIKPDQMATLPHLTNVKFDVGGEVWADELRRIWPTLNIDQQAELIKAAQSLQSSDEQGDPAVADSLGQPDSAAPPETIPLGGSDASKDPRAAQSLEEILRDLNNFAFETLSLDEWKKREADLLQDEHAKTTVFLFDRSFEREKGGSENEGFDLVRAVLDKAEGMCGLITHTVPTDGEYEAWVNLAHEHKLDQDRFVVISKQRLTSDPPNHYSFLRMVRLAALSWRCAAVKMSAWKVFTDAIGEAKADLERLSVLDFDQIVLASSRREGVWEPDTLFRVFGIFLRREARQRLYEDSEADMATVVSEARRVSAVPDEVAAALCQEQPSQEALRIQRFETYEFDAALNRFCLPIELGDIFERGSDGKRYILLAQPCDLMVRNDGKRSYDKKNRRSGALVELVTSNDGERVKSSWSEIPFYDEVTGASAYVDFAKVHQVQIAVLDLCALHETGVACIEIGASCPEVVIAPWQARHERLQKLFRSAFEQYGKMKEIKKELRLLALPTPSPTVNFDPSVNKQAIRYHLKRVMRLLQPRSGALLTAFTQYQARAAFEHPFDHRLPIVEEPSEGP